MLEDCKDRRSSYLLLRIGAIFSEPLQTAYAAVFQRYRLPTRSNEKHAVKSAFL